MNGNQQMIRRLRRCIPLSIVALLAVTLGGCGGGSSESSGSTILKVRVWSDWTYVKSAADEFEQAHPGVKVQIDGFSSGDYFESLRTTLASTGAPDVTSLQVIPGTYSALVKDGLLADLSPIWDQQHLDRHYRKPTTVRYTAADGKHYAISTALQWTPIVYYNQEAFKKAGVQAPAGRTLTLSKWYDITSKLSKAGYVPLATYGISDEFGAAFLLGSMLRSSCGEAAYDNFLNNWAPAVPDTSHWTDPCATAAIDVVKSWASKGILGKAPASQSSAASLALFQSGRAAMYESGSWETKSLPTYKLGFGYDWFLLPSAENGIASNMMLADLDGLGVNAKSQHLQLARDFVGLVSSEKFQSTADYFNNAGVPPRGDVQPPTGFDKVKSEQLKAIETLGSSTQLTVAVPYNADIAPLLARMLAGELTTTQVGSALDALVTKARSAG